MLAEIPAFLHHLTTLPPVDFSHDRSGFTPKEHTNSSLIDIKNDSKSSLYRAIHILVEDLFLNELTDQDSFLADVKAIKHKFFERDAKVDLSYIRTVIKNEYNLSPSAASINYSPFVNELRKQGRPYLFKRELFTKDISTTNILPF
jgi:hypothetical protein